MLTTGLGGEPVSEVQQQYDPSPLQHAGPAARCILVKLGLGMRGGVSVDNSRAMIIDFGKLLLLGILEFMISRFPLAYLACDLSAICLERYDLQQLVRNFSSSMHDILLFIAFSSAVELAPPPNGRVSCCTWSATPTTCI